MYDRLSKPPILTIKVATMAKDDGNTKSKKIDASPSSRSGSADGLRRSGRETPSKKQATESPSSIATRSGRIENQTAPSSSPIKKKPDKMEEQVGPSPLRRSDRGKKQLPPDSSGSKKLVEVPASSNIKLKKEETASSSQQDSVDVSVDNTNDTKSEKQDTDVGGRKRKRMTVRGYKALFKPQRVGLFKPPEVRIEADDGEDPHTQQASPQANASSNGGIESGNGEKQNGGDFLCLHTDDGEDPHTQQAPQANASSNGGIESGNGEKQNGGKCSLDDNGKIPTGNDVEYCVDSDNHIAHKSPSSECKKNGNDETCIESSKEQRIDDDLESQPDLDTHDKTCDKDLNGTPTFEVRKTPEEAVVMNNNNTENNDEKFVEFWVPVQISNVQLEQYCATLLSEAMALRSNSKNRSFEALHNILTSNRKCCDHPYIVDKDLPIQIVKDQPPDIHWDLSFKTSGKLHFLDLILPEVKKRNLKVVILFQFLPQPTVTPGQKKPVGTGDILDDFACKRFGEDSYTRVDGVGMKKPAIEEAFNKFNTNQNTFIFILEHRHCHSIKLSQVDIVIIFNSDLHPSNDIKALQKISIESNSDNPQKIMIFRLYSKNTLEEKILKLAEQNYTLQNLNRSTCDSLLMFGAKDLFEKLADFHEESGKEISCEEKFLKDVIEEFLVILSNKCLKDGEKMITRVERCGYYGNKNVASREIKKQLVDVDGEQPYVFWRNLLEGKYPRWKFVPVTTSRQRKRPQLLYNFDSSDSIAPVADGAKRRKRSPAAKTVAEKETGGANEGNLGGHSDSQSPPGGHYWSVADSVYDLLKPNVCKLCEILKFPEDVKKTVERFLEFVLANYDVIKEHTTTLQAFVISLGWIGASLSNHEIDRTESFALAKNHFNFNCTEIETDLVYKKLQKAKEEFLGKHDQATSAEPKKSTESQHDQNVEISDESNEETLEVTEKESEEIEEFEREWERKRVNLENDNKVEKSMIRALYSNPSTRSEKLNALEKEFANKLEEHERNKEIQLKQLKQTLLAAEGQVADDNELPQNPETSISVEKQDGGDDKMTETPLGLDGGKVQDQSKEKDSLGVGDDTDSIGSYTSEKQMVDAIVSSVPIIVVLPHQHDGIDDDVAITEEIPEQQNDVEEAVDSVELGVPEVNSNEENAKGDTGGADVAVSVENGEAEVPGGDDEKGNGEDGNISPDTSHAGDEQNDSCGSSSSNQPSAGVPQDDTPSVQLLAPQASDHPIPTILEVIENESLQEQPSNLEIQDKEMQVDPVSLAEIDVVDNLPPVDAQINSEERHDDPMAEIQSDVNPANEVLPQTICENDANAPEPTTLQSGGNVEEEEQPHLGSDAVNNQQTSEQPIQPETPNRSTLQHEINMFEAQVATRMPTHGDPLQAELDRLCAVNDHVIKFYENTKQRLTSECEKEIAEMMTRITQKYEAKKKEEETVFLSKKKEIDATLKRVVLNKILAEAFRAKCRDHTSSERGMLQVSQSGLMQQLHRSFVRPSFTVPLPSPGQPSERQQTPPPPPSSSPPPQPPPPSQPPLQIVHQPAALFSNTVIRPPPPNNNFRPPASTPPTPTTRPPPNISPTTRPLPTTTPTSRPLPTTTPTSRPLPTTTPTSRPPPTSTPTARPPPNITPVTPATRQPATTTPTARPPPNITPVTPATRPPPSVARSAGSIRAPAPHLRPFKPSTSASPDLSPKIVTVALPVPGQHVTPPPISQPPVLPPLSTSSEPSLPPLPPEASYVPPPPPPSPLPPSASSLQPSQSQPPPPPPPQSPPPQPPPPQTHQHGGTEYELLDLTDIFPEDDGAHLSTGHDLVYLSDDD